MHRPIDFLKKKKDLAPRYCYSTQPSLNDSFKFKFQRNETCEIYYLSFKLFKLDTYKSFRDPCTNYTRLEKQNKTMKWKGRVQKKNITRRGRSTYLFRSLRFSKRVHLDIETSRERKAIKITRLFVDTVELRHGKLTFRRWRGRLSWNFNRLGAPFLPRPSQSRREYRELTVKCFFTNKLAKSWQRARAPPNLC